MFLTRWIKQAIAWYIKQQVKKQRWNELMKYYSRPKSARKDLVFSVVMAMVICLGVLWLTMYSPLFGVMLLGLLIFGVTKLTPKTKVPDQPLPEDAVIYEYPEEEKKE